MKENTENGLYLMLGEIKGDIRSVLNRMESVSKTQANYKADTDKRLNNHSDRLSALEQFRWKLAGVALAIPFVVTALGWYIRSL